MFKILVFILIFLLLLCLVVFAQDLAVRFLSSVDKNELGMDDLLNLKISVEGNIPGNPKIELPKLEQEFFIVATSHSENIVIKAGKSNSVYVSNITLMPKRPGEIIIPAAELKVGSKVYKSEPIKIKVIPGNPLKESPSRERGDNAAEEQFTL